MINGVIHYTLNATGVLTGRWTQFVRPEGEIQSGTERAESGKRTAAIAGTYNAEICDSAGIVGWAGVLEIEGTAESFQLKWIPGEKWVHVGAFEGVGFMPDAGRAVAAYWSVS